MTITRVNSIPSLRHYSSTSINEKPKRLRVEKSVRFTKTNSRDLSLHVRLIHPIKDQDKKNVHSSHADKQGMRDDAYEVARIESSHGNTLPNPASYSSLITRAYQSCCDDKKRKGKGNLHPEEHQQLINYISQSHADSRGLEKLILEPSIKENRSRLRRNALRDLIERHTIEMANKGYLSSKVEASIVENYRRSSRSSRRFARLLAQLDEEAVKRESQNNEVKDQKLSTPSFRAVSPRTVVEHISVSSDIHTNSF
eukprot:CAMPEP_0194232096 /NCGR_PEP_ID=MMETSP0158-20130606/596_1 /TAXON_ID=33649 /ORGANISM="Thalassionema nitzschioides, Strain L26-B" /LENGTH=254 /DNA_ID=CAMNT_0038964813 /DNA_START=8 /DNA_END=772 /DNA_ORIENTATION=-